MTHKDFYFKHVWDETLNKIYESHRIDDDSFNQYFIQSSKLESFNNDGAIITVPDFITYSILDQNKEMIKFFLKEVVEKEGDPLNEDFSVRILREDQYEDIQENESSYDNQFIYRSVDPSFTFINFVIGRSNAQAQIAAWTCANNLGIVYNPLFIYGNSGLGKTHLLNAIGNFVLSTKQGKKVGFISGLDFVEGVSNSIKEKKIDEFKKSFQDLDLL
ncbi:MAG: chromosomal replication initiator protein DnaA, partial [Erysipelotrichaceae bacterium]|nr:chromosomal replication initiator protein DnaA [Erysipelotrichaceae bacterium]